MTTNFCVFFKGDDDDTVDSRDIFENVVENDAGEDILLQKLAEENEQQAAQQDQPDQIDQDEEGSSSRKYPHSDNSLKILRKRNQIFFT